MYLREGMGSGLKIVVSAVQSRPSPAFFSATYLGGMFFSN
jgi:hypothetical protein